MWTEPATDTSGDSKDQYVRHSRNFPACVKSRKEPNSDRERAHCVATVCHLANLSRRTGRKLRWDAELRACLKASAGDYPKRADRPRAIGTIRPNVATAPPHAGEAWTKAATTTPQDAEAGIKAEAARIKDGEARIKAETARIKDAEGFLDDEATTPKLRAAHGKRLPHKHIITRRRFLADFVEGIVGATPILSSRRDGRR